MGHCSKGPHMESNKQEKYNLMHDNPVAKHASEGSWMSKHSKSAFQMGHSPAEMGHDSPAKNKVKRKGKKLTKTVDQLVELGGIKGDGSRKHKRKLKKFNKALQQHTEVVNDAYSKLTPQEKQSRRIRNRSFTPNKTEK